MVDTWKDVITVTIALCGFGFGLYQYRIAQRIAKAKFSAELTDKIYQDEELRAAWNFIDWDDHETFLPAKCSRDGKNPVPFPHKVAELKHAMSMNNRQILTNGYTDLKDEYRKYPYIEYVNVFDRCFSFIETIDGYLESKVIEARYIPDILYMLNRIDQLQLGADSVFEEYLVYYKYDGVLRLIEFAKMYLADDRQWFLRRQAKTRAAKRISTVNERLQPLIQAQKRMNT